MHKPHLFTRIFFWLLLGLLSTFFAEVLSGSAPDFLLTTFGYLGIFPIYWLHTILLASLVIGKSRGFSLRSLYFASLLFGMYEAYITKVLWSPPWNPDALRFANVAVIETILLVFFWHSIFSFIIPLFVGEYLLNDSNRLHMKLMEKWQGRVSKYKYMIFFGLISSILLGTAIPTLEKGLVLTLVNLLSVTAAILLWRFFTRKAHYDLADLLPRKVELIILGVLLLLIYLNFGFNINRQVHPGFTGQAAILVLYVVIFILTVQSLRRDKEELPFTISVSNETSKAFSLKHWFVFCGTLLAGVVLINLLPQDFQDLLSGAMFVIYVTLGVIFFVISVKDLLTKRKSDIELTS